MFLYLKGAMSLLFRVGLFTQKVLYTYEAIHTVVFENKFTCMFNNKAYIRSQSSPTCITITHLSQERFCEYGGKGALVIKQDLEVLEGDP